MRAYRRFGVDVRSRGPSDADGDEDGPRVEPTPLPATRPAGEAATDPRQEAQAWSALLLRLVRELDRHHPAASGAAKREHLMRALCLADADPARLRTRVAGVIDGWVRPPAGGPSATTPHAGGGRNPGFAGLSGEAAAAAAHLAGATLPVRPGRQAAGAAAPAQDPVATDLLPARLADQPGVPDKLRDLLTLVLDNIARLTPEHHLLETQVDEIRNALAGPLTGEALARVEAQLRQLMARQAAIRSRIEEAKGAIKEMVAVMIARLATMADTTGGYSERLDRYAGSIREASDLPALTDVVRRLLDDTRNLSSDMIRARDEIAFAKARVQEHENRVEALERELQRIGALVRTDPLTETLNRRGFEEAYSVELARAERCGEPISVGLLDLDDFKNINDQHGHQTGDMALRYLTDVMRACLRPVDAIGRYGGEEFAILMPNTRPDEAAATMQRIQRELTRRIFMHDNQRLLVTFSAGVAGVDPALGLAEALERCDAAMYTAKRAGKNRVLVAAMA
ncbi:GGDEF domain-containing protein [Derxia gummosa]|uniref:diguanylate cyclase n=1 Tax=Derxia gummosa DSM 723 TaxID=1121388 RepID=A0A8B6XCK6_9BURK|nr:GGDEF domain-containing protein [Derxia gummosa]